MTEVRIVKPEDCTYILKRKPINPGEIIKTWKVISHDHNKQYINDDGRTCYQRIYKTECINCGSLCLRNYQSIHKQGCSNCYMMPKGQSGCNRLISFYKRNAKNANRIFDLSPEHFRNLTSSSCYYCGSPPSMHTKCNKYYKEALKNKQSIWGDYIYNGIDRKDNNIGYTQNNCVPCCKFCNTGKRDSSYKEFHDHWISIYTRISQGILPTICDEVQYIHQTLTKR